MDDRPALDLSMIQAKLLEFIRIDYRSLAAFRIGLGLLLIADIAMRWPDRTDLYSDSGVLPRGAYFHELAYHPEHWSLYYMNGTTAWTTVLFIVSLGVGAAMMIGYRTRIFTVFGWILLVSLQNRNPVVMDGGDVLFRLLFFWAMFLPLNRRWSLDGQLGRGPSPDYPGYAGAGSVAILTQVVLVYLCTGLMKTSDAWTTDHTAIYRVFHLEYFAKPLATWLLNFPDLLRFLTATSRQLEIYGFLLAFVPVWTAPLRTLCVCVFWTFHVGIAATLYLGLFPPICMVAWIVFLPAWFWDRLVPRFAWIVRGAWAQAMAKRVGGWIAPETAPGSSPRPLEKPLEAWRRAGSGIGQLLAGVVLVVVVLWNFHTLDPDRHPFPQASRPLMNALRLNQEWKMFVPKPSTYSKFYIVAAQQFDGQMIDLWRNGEPLSWSPPEPFFDNYPNHRWAKYLRTVGRENNSEYRRYLGRWLTRQWNDKHVDNLNKRLDTLKILEMRRLTPEPGEPLPEYLPRTLWRHRCWSDSARAKIIAEIKERGLDVDPELENQRPF